MSLSQTPAQFRNPLQQGRVLVPGMPVLAENTERHPVPPTGSRAVEIRAGDEFAVVDDEGKQRTELVFFTPDGKSDVGVFAAGTSNNSTAVGLQTALSSEEPSAQRVAAALKESGFDLAAAQAVSVFDTDSPAGNTVNFTSDKDGLLIVCAVGEAMAPDAQNTPTSVTLYVKRLQPLDHKGSTLSSHGAVSYTHLTLPTILLV